MVINTKYFGISSISQTFMVNPFIIGVHFHVYGYKWLTIAFIASRLLYQLDTTDHRPCIITCSELWLACDLTLVIAIISPITSTALWPANCPVNNTST